MSASENKWLAKTSDIVVDQFAGHNGEDLSTTLAAIAANGGGGFTPDRVIIIDSTLPQNIEGKAYTTFAAARTFTNSNAQRNIKHTIILPSGTFSEDVTVDPNLTIIGTNTVLSGGLTSNCTAKDVGVLRNCQVATVAPSSPLSFGTSGTVLTLTNCIVGFQWGFTSSDTPVDPTGKTIYVSDSQVSGNGLYVYNTVYDQCTGEFNFPSIGWSSDTYTRTIKVYNSNIRLALHRQSPSTSLEVINCKIETFTVTGPSSALWESIKFKDCIIQSFNQVYAGTLGSPTDPAFINCTIDIARVRQNYPVYISGTQLTLVESAGTGPDSVHSTVFAYNHSTVFIDDNFNQGTFSYGSARICDVILDTTSNGIPSSVVTTGYTFNRSTLTDVLYADVTTSGSTTTYSNVSQTYTNQTHIGIAGLTDGRPAQVPSAGGTIDHPEWYTWVVRSSTTSVIPRRVIIVNPDIAQADEVEGKLYRTYFSAYAWTQTGNNGANANQLFQIMLPSGTVNEQITLNDNLIVTGHNTVISDQVRSYCSRGSTAKIEHCYFDNDVSTGVYFEIVTDAIGHTKRQLVIESSTLYGGYFDAADAESGKPGHFIIRNSTIHTEDDPNFTVQGDMDIENSYIYSNGDDEYPGLLTLIEATNNASTLKISGSILSGGMLISGQWVNNRATGIELINCTVEDGVMIAGYDANATPQLSEMQLTDCILGNVSFSGLSYLEHCCTLLPVTHPSYVVPIAGASIVAHHCQLRFGGPSSEPASYGEIRLLVGSLGQAMTGSPAYTNVRVDNTSYLLGTRQYIAGTITEAKHHAVETATLPASGWSGTSYTVTGLSNVYSDVTVVVSPDPSDIVEYCDCSIYCSGQGDGTLTFTYTDHAPTSAITVNILILD